MLSAAGTPLHDGMPSPHTPLHDGMPTFCPHSATAGWCVFEEYVALIIVGADAFRDEQRKREDQLMPPKLVHAESGERELSQAPTPEEFAAKLSQATFTGAGDRERVHNMYIDLYIAHYVGGRMGAILEKQQEASKTLRSRIHRGAQGVGMTLILAGATLTVHAMARMAKSKILTELLRAADLVEWSQLSAGVAGLIPLGVAVSTLAVLPDEFVSIRRLAGGAAFFTTLIAIVTVTCIVVNMRDPYCKYDTEEKNCSFVSSLAYSVMFGFMSACSLTFSYRNVRVYLRLSDKGRESSRRSRAPRVELLELWLNLRACMSIFGVIIVLGMTIAGALRGGVLWTRASLSTSCGGGWLLILGIATRPRWRKRARSFFGQLGGVQSLVALLFPVGIGLILAGIITHGVHGPMLPVVSASRFLPEPPPPPRNKQTGVTAQRASQVSSHLSYDSGSCCVDRDTLCEL